MDRQAAVVRDRASIVLVFSCKPTDQLVVTCVDRQWPVATLTDLHDSTKLGGWDKTGRRLWSSLCLAGGSKDIPEA